MELNIFRSTFFISLITNWKFCSSSIALSEQENILSDVLPKKQSIAIVQQREEKQGGKGTKLIENSKVSKKELKSDQAVNKPPALRKSISKNMAASIFDLNSKVDRPAPELPSTEGIEYPRAAAWASESLSNVLKDEKGRQLFLVFLHDALAEENLSFIESYEKFKVMTSPAEKKKYVQEFFEKYSPYVNLSSVAMQDENLKKIKETAAKDDPDPAAFLLAVKEVNRLLENDQFPRFKRSDVYIKFLEKVMPRAYADKWATNFEALVGNQAILFPFIFKIYQFHISFPVRQKVGRYHFRYFLRNIHAEENLRFWEAVIEYKQMKNKSTAMLNMGRNIQKQYLVEGTANEIFLPFGLRQVIDSRIEAKDVDNTLFDEAVKHVEQVLKNDPYVRFLQSAEYNDLLVKLK
uniref:RGS domain-containing protein n=1 Tax=Elaeophora elaphi TaxID=1147741 RepID=A0A0R3RIL5_9BILA